MSVLIACANGNLTDAATWALGDSTSYSNSETSSRTLTTAYTGTRSQAFTPGAITIDAILVKLSIRLGVLGTMSVSLFNSTAGSDVAGTEVTIDTADLPFAISGDINGGWILFKLASPVLLLAATNYMVQAKTSAASQVSLFGASTSNLSRVLRTTTTQALIAGDDMIICGEKTGAGAETTRTVIMDSTATTDYGSASTSLVTPAMSICDGGTLSYGTTAATNYYLRLSGCLIIYAGGTFNMGTVGGEIPRDSTAKLNFDCGANVDFGLVVKSFATWVARGLSRTSGKNIISCKLNTDEAIASTSLGVDTDTGWLDNDEIAVASTTRTATQSEKGMLNGNAGASSLTVDGFAGAGGGLQFAHIGSDPCPAEVILLTRNVQIFGTSASLQSYILLMAAAVVDIEWTEIYWMGSATANKRGIDMQVLSSGSCNIQYCSIHDFIVASSIGLNLVAQFNITFSNTVMFGVASTMVNGVVANSSSTWVFDNNIFINNVTGGPVMTLGTILGTITNNTFVGGTIGLSLSGSLMLGTISGNYSHSTSNVGMSLSNFIGGTLSNLKSVRCSSFGFSLSTLNDVTLDGIIGIGNATINISMASTFNCKFLNVSLNGDTGFSTATGIVFTNGHSNTQFIDCSIGVAAGALTAHTTDLSFNSTTTGALLNFINVGLGSATKVGSQTNLSDQSSASFQNYNNTAGDHRIFKKRGTIAVETSTVQAGSHGLKMTPNNATNKLQSPVFQVAVASGQTVTPSVYVQEDGSYNGNRARLFVKCNDAIGITADTLLATATAASDGAWEELTGTTDPASADGVMEFYIDCDGSAGNLFVDTFTVS